VEPRNWKYWENLGRALHNNKQNEQSLEAYKQALAINSGAFTTHYDMGVVYNDLGRITESAQAYIRALQCEGGDDYRVHFNLGNALIQLNRPRDAEKHCRRALELRPGFKKALQQLNSIQSQTSTG
jgi:tetratricopeptide (TPR) repeat protein